MKVFANREIRNLFQAVLAVWAVALALTQGLEQGGGAKHRKQSAQWAVA
jgi:hypothetical protein